MHVLNRSIVASRFMFERFVDFRFSLFTLEYTFSAFELLWIGHK